MRRFALPLLFLAAAAAAATLAAPAAAHPGHAGCAEFANQALAQVYFLSHGGPADDFHELDEDGDGIACEQLPCPCNLSTTPIARDVVADRDHDGVPDAADACPAEWAATATGCPAGDAPPPTAPGRTYFTAVATGVPDGRTLRVRRRGRTETVRLLGIDAPRLRPGPECGSRAARSALLWQAFTSPRDRDGDGLFDARGGAGARLEVFTDPTQPARDAAGRLLAYVHADGRSLARALLRRGWVAVDLSPTPFEQLSAFRASEAIARDGSRGVWRRCGGDFHLR